MKVLVIEHAEGRSDHINHLLRKAGAEMILWQPYRGSAVPKEFDGLILTGGPMDAMSLAQDRLFADEIQLIEQSLDQQAPILGICLGCQLLAYLSGGTLAFAQTWQRGWFPVSLTEEGKNDPIFNECQNPFSVFEYHQDQVTGLPNDSVLIATSVHCEIEGFRLLGVPVWGVQGHIEVTPQKAEQIFLPQKKKLSGQGVDVEAEINKGYQQINMVGDQIFANFVQTILLNK